jgi:serine/threonine-protein kinase
MHRDVKPENILITRDDFAYLVDFGIANAATDESLTELGTAVGTYAYMAPERFTNDEVTYRADIYALACVLHECLTGTQPYPADSVSVVITAHLMQPIPQPSVVRPGIPAAFDPVVARGMAKDPNVRFATAGDLAAAARGALGTRDQDKTDTILSRSAAANIPGAITPPPTSQPAPTTPASFLTPPPGSPPPWSATPPPPTPPPFTAASTPSWQPQPSGPMPSAQPPKRSQLPIIAAVVGVILLLGGAVIAAVLLSSGGSKNNTATDTTTSEETTAEETTETETETTTDETTVSQPPVNVAGKWVAIVYSPATGAFGWSNNADSKDQATDLAMGYCKQYGGTDCTLAAWASDKCVALAKSDTNWHGGLGPTIEAAEEDATTENNGGTILISKCST